ncbi:hypothetical protein FRX31_031900 [Thalictrum thalictroides]|uniref:Uncharacterized protein n=1 Tax=Thalictrum thalictroides TaxID=46969 RepID=A0A7J6V2N4_THATH|nr:hypothetical protein FRX31_031900 [Thalictrum thalictroides]
MNEFFEGSISILLISSKISLNLSTLVSTLGWDTNSLEIFSSGTPYFSNNAILGANLSNGFSTRSRGERLITANTLLSVLTALLRKLIAGKIVFLKLTRKIFGSLVTILASS